MSPLLPIPEPDVGLLPDQWSDDEPAPISPTDPHYRLGQTQAVLGIVLMHADDDRRGLVREPEVSIPVRVVDQIRQILTEQGVEL